MDVNTHRTALDRAAQSLRTHAGTGLGVDGCRGGWVWARVRAGRMEFGLHPDIASLWNAFRNLSRVLVDMPVGLPHAAMPARPCDMQARRLLGARRSSVFSPPCREALAETDHGSANAVNRAITGRGLSIQAFHIGPRIRELDVLLRSDARARSALLEAHPELAFAAFLGAPAKENKKTAGGREQREEILCRLCPDMKGRIVKEVKKLGSGLASPDDLADAAALALACALTARPAPGLPRLRRLGRDPDTGTLPLDAEGLAMTIHTPAWPDGHADAQDS